MGLQDKMIEKLIKKAMGGDMPDISQLMGGYDFKNGILKADVEYWIDKNAQNDLKLDGDGVIILRSDSEYTASALNIGTTLTLKIIPPTIAFVYIPISAIYPKTAFNILLPNEEKHISFYCFSNQSSHFVRDNIKKGTAIGYGFFIPYTPINSINFINKNADTP